MCNLKEKRLGIFSVRISRLVCYKLHIVDFSYISELGERLFPNELWKKIRTTNILERDFREVRRRTRPMDGFKSPTGAANFLRVWLIKENARMAREHWLKSVVN